MLDKIIKITPLAGTVLIFSGVLKLIFFYSHFNIRIIDYLEFQEIITSFLGDFNIIVIFGITMALISFMTFNFLGKRTGLPINELLDKMLHIVYPHRFRYFIGFFTVALILFLLTYFKILSNNYVVIYFLTFCTIQMLTYLFLHKEDNGEIDIPIFFAVLIFGLSLTISLYQFAQHDIQEIKTSHSETTLVLDNTTIICNKQTKNLYIGKTSKFVFVKFDSLNSTMVIPAEDIKRYEFK